MNLGLTNKVAMVAGASRGLGFAVSRALSLEGAMISRGGGAILLATSSAVKEPIGNIALSTVMRTSVSSLSKILSAELAPHKIRVNQLIPGRIFTDRVKEIDEDNARRAGITVSD